MALPANLATNEIIDETWVDAVTNNIALTDPAMLNLLKAEFDVRYEGPSTVPGPPGPAGPEGPQGWIGPVGPAGPRQIVSDTAPIAVAPGDQWFNTTNGRQYVWYDGFWVEIGTSFQGGIVPDVVAAALAADPAFTSRFMPLMGNGRIGLLYACEGVKGTSTAMSVGYEWYCPINLLAGTYDQLQFNCLGAGGAGSVVRLGLYANADGGPSTLLLDAGTVDTSTTGLKTITISRVLAAGRYWLSNTAQVGTTPSTYVVTANTNLPLLTGGGWSGGYYKSGVTGALSNASGYFTNVSVQSGVSIRRAS